MARRKARREDIGFNWIDAELKAFPELDEGFNIDLLGLETDFTELDSLLKFDDVPGLSLDFDNPAEQPASALAGIKGDAKTGKTARRDAKRALNRHKGRRPGANDNATT